MIQSPSSPPFIVPLHHMQLNSLSWCYIMFNKKPSVYELEQTRSDLSSLCEFASVIPPSIALAYSTKDPNSYKNLEDFSRDHDCYLVSSQDFPGSGFVRALFLGVLTQKLPSLGWQYIDGAFWRYTLPNSNLDSLVSDTHCSVSSSGLNVDVLNCNITLQKDDLCILALTHTVRHVAPFNPLSYLHPRRRIPFLQGQPISLSAQSRNYTNTLSSSSEFSTSSSNNVRIVTLPHLSEGTVTDMQILPLDSHYPLVNLFNMQHWLNTHPQNSTDKESSKIFPFLSRPSSKKKEVVATKYSPAFMKDYSSLREYWKLINHIQLNDLIPLDNKNTNDSPTELSSSVMCRVVFKYSSFSGASFDNNNYNNNALHTKYNSNSSNSLTYPASCLFTVYPPLANTRVMNNNATNNNNSAKNISVFSLFVQSLLSLHSAQTNTQIFDINYDINTLHLDKSYLLGDMINISDNHSKLLKEINDNNNTSSFTENVTIIKDDEEHNTNGNNNLQLKNTENNNLHKNQDENSVLPLPIFSTNTSFHSASEFNQKDTNNNNAVNNSVKINTPNKQLENHNQEDEKETLQNTHSISEALSNNNNNNNNNHVQEKKTLIKPTFKKHKPTFHEVIQPNNNHLINSNINSSGLIKPTFTPVKSHVVIQKPIHSNPDSTKNSTLTSMNNNTNFPEKSKKSRKK